MNRSFPYPVSRLPVALVLVLVTPAISGCIDVGDLLFGAPEPIHAVTELPSWATVLAPPGLTRADTLSFTIDGNVTNGFRIIDGLALLASESAAHTDDDEAGASATGDDANPKTASLDIPLAQHRTVFPNMLTGRETERFERAVWLVRPDGATQRIDAPGTGGTQAGKLPTGVLRIEHEVEPGTYTLITYGDIPFPAVDLRLAQSPPADLAATLIETTDKAGNQLTIWPHTFKPGPLAVQRTWLGHQDPAAVPSTGPDTATAMATLADHDRSSNRFDDHFNGHFGEGLLNDGTLTLPGIPLWTWLTLTGAAGPTDATIRHGDTTLDEVFEPYVARPHGDMYDGLGDLFMFSMNDRRPQSALPAIQQVNWTVDGQGSLDAYIHTYHASTPTPDLLKAHPALAHDATQDPLSYAHPLDGTIRPWATGLLMTQPGSALALQAESKEDRTVPLRIIDPTTGETLLRSTVGSAGRGLIVVDLPGPVVVINDGSTSLSARTDTLPGDALIHTVETRTQSGTFHASATTGPTRTLGHVEAGGPMLQLTFTTNPTARPTDMIASVLDIEGRTLTQDPPIERLRPDGFAGGDPLLGETYRSPRVHHTEPGMQRFAIDLTSGDALITWYARIVDLTSIADRLATDGT